MILWQSFSKIASSWNFSLFEERSSVSIFVKIESCSKIFRHKTLLRTTLLNPIDLIFLCLLMNSINTSWLASNSNRLPLQSNKSTVNRLVNYCKALRIYIACESLTSRQFILRLTRCFYFKINWMKLSIFSSSFFSVSFVNISIVYKLPMLEKASKIFIAALSFTLTLLKLTFTRFYWFRMN